MFSKNSLLAKYQKALLDHLSYICNILEKNQIWYSLSSGTLLGAIREQGFISWDDDIDIMIKIEDFERVKAVLASKDNLHELKIINDSYLKTWDKRYIARFKNKKSGYPTLDIFCLANVDLRNLNYLKWQVFRVISFASLGENHSDWEIPSIAKIPQFFNKYFFFFINFTRMHNSLLKRHLVKNYSDKICSDVANFSWSKNEWFLISDWKTEKHKFEDQEFNVAKNYVEILNNQYGTNWRTPHTKRPLTRTHTVNRLISIERVDLVDSSK